MRKTDAGVGRNELRKRDLKLAREEKAAMKAAGILPEASRMELQKGQTSSGRTQKSLKDQARGEDLSVWKLERSRAPRRAAGPTIIGWPAGGRHARPGMCIWGAVPRWMRSYKKKPGRRRVALGIKP